MTEILTKATYHGPAPTMVRTARMGEKVEVKAGDTIEVDAYMRAVLLADRFWEVEGVEYIEIENADGTKERRPNGKKKAASKKK